ncbi:beta-C1 protein [Cardiospermum yellow leaf curl betasatellite]|uniref:Beta-C1 protein n=1 Tax=Cardiospermum yellow leaf curl betasatellite TaxID=497865 RepID=B0JEU4_9VIRU|nr:beta-C1 protein [Cardiospermum yellow leaf curl betasatellite]CAP70057.1 beta-C1 protein [Cardiospermum yellow leaf curl betasatellite]
MPITKKTSSGKLLQLSVNVFDSKFIVLLHITDTKSPQIQLQKIKLPYSFNSDDLLINVTGLEEELMQHLSLICDEHVPSKVYTDYLISAIDILILENSQELGLQVLEPCVVTITYTV